MPNTHPTYGSTRRGTRRRHGLGLVLLALALAVPGPAEQASADDAKWRLDWSTRARAADGDRVLNAIERGMASALEAAPEAFDLRMSANRLINTRMALPAQRQTAARAEASVQEAKARLERDERRLSERKGTQRWLELDASEKSRVMQQESTWVDRIRGVTRNRQREAQKHLRVLRRTRSLLQAYATSWGDLAVERAIATPGEIIRLSGDRWHQTMASHAAPFNGYVSRAYAACTYLDQEPARDLAKHRTPAPDPMATSPLSTSQPLPRDPMPDLPAGTSNGGANPRGADRGPWDPQPQPQPTPGRVIQDPEPVFPRTQPEPAAPVTPPRVPAAPLSNAAMETHSGVRWHTSFAGAQAAARAQRKLVFCLSSRPSCHICHKVRDETVPPNIAALERVAVLYIYNIEKPESRSLDASIRKGLPYGVTMPLVGFVTPDMGWVHGWSGWHTPEQFRGDIRAASRGR